LQTATVIGVEVPVPLLQALAELLEVAVHAGLRQLQAAEFLYETHFVSEHDYTCVRPCSLGCLVSIDVALADTHYRHALALADELGMRPLVAHCHAGLGTLYTTTGRWEQAHTELATAITLYRAMAMTFWLQQTEATLAQVLHAPGSLGVSH
jgi:hypothetical protein